MLVSMMIWYGLLSSSAWIGWIGYPATVSLYVVAGMVFTVLIGYRWRRLLWRRDVRSIDRSSELEGSP